MAICRSRGCQSNATQRMRKCSLGICKWPSFRKFCKTNSPNFTNQTSTFLVKHAKCPSLPPRRGSSNRTCPRIHSTAQKTAKEDNEKREEKQKTHLGTYKRAAPGLSRKALSPSGGTNLIFQIIESFRRGQYTSRKWDLYFLELKCGKKSTNFPDFKPETFLWELSSTS